MEILRFRDGRTHVFGASRKRFRLNKWHALSVGLLVVVIAQAVFVGFLNWSPQSNSASSSAYDSLNKDYLALQANYDSLQKQYETLNMEYLSLQNSSSSSDSRY